MVSPSLFTHFWSQLFVLSTFLQQFKAAFLCGIMSVYFLRTATLIVDQFFDQFETMALKRPVYNFQCSSSFFLSHVLLEILILMAKSTQKTQT